MGILGFWSGSSMPDTLPGSRDEDEFDTAGKLGIPRLVYLLPTSRDLVLPAEVRGGPDRQLANRAQTFRARVGQASLVRELVRTPADLEAGLYRALVELADQVIPAGAVGTGSDHAGHRAPSGEPVFAVPPLRSGDVPRPELTRQLLDRLGVGTGDTASAPSPGGAVVGTAAGMTTGLVGAGGFGKTTLARMLVHDPAVRAGFSDGIVWLTLGDGLSGAELADRVDDACAAVTGTKPPHADPLLAGAALGRALGRKRMLLVLDDAWSPAQVQPFLSGGPNTIRLVTTRHPSSLPEGAARVDVDAMTSSLTSRAR